MVPHDIRISWNHLDGEQRLYLEGPEVVQTVGLAAHYESRFRAFWLRNPPRERNDVYVDYSQHWAKKAVRYGIIGGHGEPPSHGLISRTHRKVAPEVSAQFSRFYKHRHDDQDKMVSIH